MGINQKKQKEYDKFVNKQFEILKGHFSRCMIRCFNKFHKLNAESQSNTTKNNHNQRGKKVEDDGSNVTQLETRSNAEEASKTEHRTVDADNHHADTLRGDLK